MFNQFDVVGFNVCGGTLKLAKLQCNNAK